MMKAKLTRIQSKHQNLRTDEIVGQTEELPRIGSPFTLIANPLVRFANFRLVRTTPVRVIWNNSRTEYEFWTENSHYRLSVLGKVESPRSSAD